MKKKKSVSQHCTPPWPQCGETFLPDGHCEVDLLFIMYREQSKGWSLSQKIPTLRAYNIPYIFANLGFMFNIVFFSLTF